MPSMFDRLTNLFAIGSVVCALETLVFVVQLLYVSSIRLDSDVLVHEFHDPIDVLRVPHALSKIFIVHKILNIRCDQIADAD